MSLRRGWRIAGTPFLLLLPALVILVGLLVIPIADAIRLSFTSWDGFSSPRWIGLDNFEGLLHDERFKSSLSHTLLILAAIPIWVLVPYGIAWRLYAGIPGWRFFRLAFFIPVALSPAVIGVYYGIVLGLHGPLNELLRQVGLGGFAREWLNDPSIAMPIVIAILIWWTFGMGVLIFLAGLTSLDRELIDAAHVDGANGWQVQRHVVFWQLLPVVEFWAILTVIISFTAVFPLIYSLTRGGPGNATYTVDYTLYVEAFGNGHLGYASAIGVTLLVVMAIVGTALILILRKTPRRA